MSNDDGRVVHSVREPNRTNAVKNQHDPAIRSFIRRDLHQRNSRRATQEMVRPQRGEINWLRRERFEQDRQ